MKNMDKFNLEAALFGKRIMTRERKPAKCVIFVDNEPDVEYPVVVIVGKEVLNFTVNGTSSRSDEEDLFMVPDVQSYWIVLLRNGRGDVYSLAFPTKELAGDHISKSFNHVITGPVEIKVWS